MGRGWGQGLGDAEIEEVSGQETKRMGKWQKCGLCHQYSSDLDLFSSLSGPCFVKSKTDIAIKLCGCLFYVQLIHLSGCFGTDTKWITNVRVKRRWHFACRKAVSHDYGWSTGPSWWLNSGDGGVQIQLWLKCFLLNQHLFLPFVISPLHYSTVFPLHHLSCKYPKWKHSLFIKIILSSILCYHKCSWQLSWYRFLSLYYYSNTFVIKSFINFFIISKIFPGQFYLYNSFLKSNPPGILYFGLQLI